MKYIRQRYILFEVIPLAAAPAGGPPSFAKEEVLKLIWREFVALFGERQGFQAGLWMVRWDPAHNIGIIRSDNVSQRELLATFAFLTSVGRVPAIFHSRKTAGTIKKTLHRWREFFPTPPPKRD